MRTYSRNKYDGDKFVGVETFKDIIERVVNGAFSLLKDHLYDGESDYIEFSEQFDHKYERKAQKFFELAYNFKITPPGRGLWAMGTELVNGKRIALPLVNCTFITTSNIDECKQEIFAYIMDALMLGVGVGFDDRAKANMKLTLCDLPNQ
ncbi:unnamed protein product [Ascophyllum nodosum]